jgi:isopenicillin N synthase-like dioxygenase
VQALTPLEASPDGLPVIDVSPLVAAALGDPPGAAVLDVAHRIDAACRVNGFFVVTGHGVDPALRHRVEAAARGFFGRPDAEKAAVAMPLAGRTWRGWFPVGGELTAGVPDLKEGLYFGAELPPDHPRVAAGTPLHGANLFPAEPADLRPAVLAWIDTLTTLGHRLLAGVALGLGLEPGWFARHLTADPTVLFRIFRYPPAPDGPGAGPGTDRPRWGVAEHTDYGLLTILAQDGSGGLQVRSGEGWLNVPPVPDAFVCNIGDMLDRMTGGRYRSTPHRVLATDADRLSFPFFFDPSWDAEVAPLPLDGEPPTDDARTRWDATSVHEYRGTYGDYLTAKVAKVFPHLAG